jgi:hypothetical protein
MAGTTDNTLLIELGASVSRLAKDMAAAEARVNRAMKKMEADANKATNGGLDRMQRKYNEIGKEAERATARAVAGANRMQSAFAGSRGQIQNVAFQLGDFATQVGAGTSASIALGQQLPQLLGGFGALGAVLGAMVAVGVPLAAAFLSSGEAAATAADQVDELEAALKRLQVANEVYSTQGLQGVIDRYGELNAEILLLIERQRQFALESTLLAAKAAASSLRGELQEVLSNLAAYQAYMAADQSDPANLAQAQDYAAALQEEFGLTIIEAEALQLALNAAMRTDDVEVMASAIATISGVLEDSTFAGSEFAGTLLDAESALRAVNAEAGGIGGWLGAAISGASTFAANLWNAASAARAASLASGPVATEDQRLENQYGLYAFTRSQAPEFAPTSTFNGPQPPVRPMDLGVPAISTGGGTSGGSSNPAEPAYWDELIQKVKEGEQAFADYNKTVEDGANTVADFFTSILDGSKSAKEAVADLLMQLAEVQLQKSLLGLAQGNDFIGMLFGSLGSATSAPSFAGGGYTGSGARTGGIDGMGGFPAIIHPNETVIDHSKGQSGGATLNFQIDARGATADAAPAIEAAIRRAAPALIRQSVAASQAAMRSTKSFGKMR